MTYSGLATSLPFLQALLLVGMGQGEPADGLAIIFFLFITMNRTRLWGRLTPDRAKLWDEVSNIHYFSCLL